MDIMDMSRLEYRKWWMENIKYFTISEFGTDWYMMDPDFMSMLDLARHRAGIAFHVTSDFRLGDPKSHGAGRSVDIRVTTGRQRWQVVRAAMSAGFNRIGVYNKHVHVDSMMPSEGFPEEVLWVGTSR